MANSNNMSLRHVSPGVYTSETDLTYASKSLGITTLGVVGETLQGPAFQPMSITDWRNFQQVFGGTSTEKFKGSQYPKYELPYIAQEYLKKSNQLEVVRVLGLSGVNAGPAWVITAYNKDAKEGDLYTQAKPMVIGILRSRGEHRKASLIGKNECGENEYAYDKIFYYAKEVKLEAFKSLVFKNGCTVSVDGETHDFAMSSLDFGRFDIVVTLQDGTTKRYPVTLNPEEKNYIYNVIGDNPSNGDAEVFIEEFYDVAVRQLVEMGKLDTVSSTLTKFERYSIQPKFAPVDDILGVDEDMLRRSDVGKRFLFSAELSKNENGEAFKVHTKANKKDKTWTPADGENGHIYTVYAATLADGSIDYYYGEYLDSAEALGTTAAVNGVFSDCVEVLSEGSYYKVDSGDVYPITLDLNNYKEQFRYASTPWIVSEMKGSADAVELHKLFRFHMISDGDTSNTMVKVSIENIDPTNGTFDVNIRNFYDTDNAIQSVERYRGCNLVPNTDRYLGYVIGTTNGDYETKSKYVTVEINEDDLTKLSVPAGFLGYPVRNYSGRSAESTAKALEQPYFKYNTMVDDDVRVTKQYFGCSNIVGIDTDVLKYKGVEAYNELPESLTPCFHLDARLVGNNHGMKQTIAVDGVTGYEWQTVAASNTVSGYDEEPRIGEEYTMLNTIYENKQWRKFTVAFYGGWDGWDYYREARSNSDYYRYQNYNKRVPLSVGGEGENFSLLRDVESWGFDPTDKCITSDYYAYLAAANMLSNPSAVDINVLATPGIDYVNEKTLVDEVITIVEEKRADSIYVVTTPDKPYGSSDAESEMFTPTEAVANLDDSEIDSNYTATYYPWVKYLDDANNSYILLPPTKDVVANFAYTDNVRFPWFAPAGIDRGSVNAVRPHRILDNPAMDILYAGRINPIAFFKKEGIKVWGDKNLQIHESVMNRISKRRLLLYVRKLCSVAAINIVFDPNDTTLKQQFESAVKPILDKVMNNRGIVKYKIEIDDSQEARDRLELPAKIYIMPIPNVEYVTINFTITPEGTNWDDV